MPIHHIRAARFAERCATLPFDLVVWGGCCARPGCFIARSHRDCALHSQRHTVRYGWEIWYASTFSTDITLPHDGAFNHMHDRVVERAMCRHVFGRSRRVARECLIGMVSRAAHGLMPRARVRALELRRTQSIGACLGRPMRLPRLQREHRRNEQWASGGRQRIADSPQGRSQEHF